MIRINIFAFIIFILYNYLDITSADELPCDYSKSKDISSGVLNFNRSITFEGKIYEYGLYSMIDYKNDTGIVEKIEPYARACIYEDHLPCKYSDSININSGVVKENGLVEFDHMEFPNGTYATVAYDYQISAKEHKNKRNETIYLNYFKRIPKPNYLRGCACNRKSCVRFCCKTPYLTFVNGKCVGENKNVNLPIRNKDNEFSMTDFKEHFYYVTKRVCGNITAPNDDFEIHHDGHVVTDTRRHHAEYCLVNALNVTTNEFEVKRFNCLIYSEEESNLKNRILPYCILISIPFMIASIVIYLCYEKLRNVYGKSLICYLSSLTFAFIFLMITNFILDINSMNSFICKVIGYVIYLSFCSAFIWLTIVSFELWTQVSGNRQSNNRFRFYCLCGFGFTFLITILSIILESSLSEDSAWRPGFGKDACYLQNNRLTQTVFFYVPLSILLALNCIFFVMIVRILRHRRNSNEASVHRNHNELLLLLRLFVIMGIFWIMEVISFFVSEESFIFIVSDFINAIQGFLIFIAIIISKPVKKLLLQCWTKYGGKQLNTQISNTDSDNNRNAELQEMNK